MGKFFVLAAVFGLSGVIMAADTKQPSEAEIKDEEMVQPVSPKQEQQFGKKVDVSTFNKTLFEEFDEFQKEGKK